MTTTYVKPAVRSAWAEGASGTDIQDPGDAFVKAGWLQSNTPPGRQYFNWALSYSAVGVRYICQNGISAWDTNELYPEYAVSIDSAGRVVQSLEAGNTGTNPTTANQTAWGPITTITAVAGDNSTKVATTAFVASGFLKVGSTFAAIGGTIADDQILAGAVTQFQGDLTINFSQLSLPATCAFPGTVTATLFDQVSDLRMKKNVRPIEGALKRLDHLYGVTFQWRKDSAPDAGVIAQHAREALPESVSGKKVLRVRPMALIGLLVQAIKELAQALKEDRDARRALEARIEALEARR